MKNERRAKRKEILAKLDKEAISVKDQILNDPNPLFETIKKFPKNEIDRLKLKETAKLLQKKCWELQKSGKWDEAKRQPGAKNCLGNHTNVGFTNYMPKEAFLDDRRKYCCFCEFPGSA